MEIIRTDDGKRLLDLYNLVNERCTGVKYINNVFISGLFSISETNSDFINSYSEKASMWQAFERPPQLEFNHGEFIHKYRNKYNRNGLEFLVEEIKKKFDSNRAFWSLLDMSNIINTGDDPIPSFLLLQVGFKEAPESRDLIITAYYRALEVSQFLPINIAEICLVVNYINEHFGHEILKFDLNIFAFKAYIKPNFSCLQKADIDCYDPEEMGIEVTVRNSKLIADLLQNKINTHESKIRTDGMKFLYKSLELYNKKSATDTRLHAYNSKFVDSIKKSIDLINEYNKIRDVSSHSHKSTEILEKIQKELALAHSLIVNS